MQFSCVKRVLSQVVSLLVGVLISWFDWKSNYHLFSCQMTFWLDGWPRNILLPDPKCRRIPYLRPAPSRMQSNNVGICDRESWSRCRAIWFRLCPMVFHSCDYLPSKISVWKLPGNVLLKLCYSSHVQVLNAHIIMIFPTCRSMFLV